MAIGAGDAERDAWVSPGARLQKGALSLWTTTLVAVTLRVV